MATKLYEFDFNREKLWKGCMLASIAHAIMIAKYPSLANEHSWDGINYNIQNSGGTRGTITFSGELCIAAFRNECSQRVREYDMYKNIVYKSIYPFIGAGVHKYFNGASKEAEVMAYKETLPYLLDEIDGRTMAVITTAAWGLGDKFYSTDTYEEFSKHGGFLIKTQGMDYSEAIDIWKENYEMSTAQIELLETIYAKKISSPDNELILSKDEIKLIEPEDEEGLQESKVSFEEIGVKYEI